MKKEVKKKSVVQTQSQNLSSSIHTFIWILYSGIQLKYFTGYVTFDILVMLKEKSGDDQPQ